jgi:hypothetical protein
MRHEPSRRLHPLRVLLAACVALAGLVSIVGSGGGGVGFPPCGSPCDNPSPPTPTATIDPPYYTALVGSPATFTVSTANLTGTPTWQWQRSNDGGATYADIAGATAATYAIANVNLADDQAVFRAQVRVNGVVVLAPVAHLVVSAVPGVVFEDQTFLATDWLASPVPADTGAIPVTVDESLANGGNPGAYRKMTYTVPAGTGSARVFYSSFASTWDPATQGAINVIDYAEDCIVLQGAGLALVGSSLVIEQSGRRFLSDTPQSCIATTWGTVAKRASLAPADFRLFDGPACGAGEACPDFSASAAPMRFGYWRIASGTPGMTIAHGIDNWKVTVWRR